MTNLISGFPNVQRLIPVRVAWPGIAAVLLTGLGVAAGTSWMGPRGLDWTSRGVSQAKALGSDAGQFIVSLCIANPDSEAMRLWIAQHPKSKRGRLDHRRLNATGE